MAVSGSAEPAASAKPSQVRTAIVDGGVVIWEYSDADKAYTSVSPEAEGLLGYPIADWYEPLFWFNHLHPEDRDAAVDFCKAASACNQDHQFEYRMRHSDGSWRWVCDVASVVTADPVVLRGVLFDITDRRLAAGRLEESERRFRDMADQAPVLVWMTSADGGEVFYNEPWLRFVGREPGGNPAGNWSEDLHPDDRQMALDTYHAAHDRREPFELQYRLRRHDGKYRWVLDHGAPRFAGGVFSGYIGSAIDITERVEAEHRLRDSESRYRFVTENAQDMIARLDVQGRYLYVSPASRRILGIAPDELVGRNGYEFVHPDDLERVSQHHAAVLGGIPQSVILRKLHAAGHYIWSEANFRLVSDPSGSSEIVAVLRDISDRKHAEDRLRQSSRELQVILDAVPALIAHVGRNGKFTYCNRQAAMLLGRPGQALAGRRLAELVAPSGAAEVEQKIATALRGLESDHEVAVGQGRDEKIVRMNYVPDLSHRPDVAGCFVLGRDVTDRRVAEQQLRDAIDSREALLLELNHRVKNLLGGLLSLVDALQPRAADVGAFADAVRRRVRAMFEVHAVLAAHRYEPIALESLVRIMRPPEVPGEVTFSGPAVQIPARQATALGVVVQELMSNSLRHGALGRPDGRVEVEWTIDAARSSRTLVISWVERGVVAAPDPRPGMGTQLIEGFMKHELRGVVRFGYKPDGVRHELVATLDDEAEST